MINKKSRVLLLLVCPLFLLLIAGIVFVLPFQSQASYAVAEVEAVEQDLSVTADGIFENYTQTTLKKDFNDRGVLQQLKENNEISDEEYERGLAVLNGEAKYVTKREFSTAFENDNKIEQVGDIAKYSQEELNCIWQASEIIVTGIYGMPGDTFNIFVEANETTDNLPYIIFSQNHGYYLHWFNKEKLKAGMNKFTFPTFGLSYIDEKEIRGGAVYLCNPYFPDEQGKVNVYIEGGGYYPVFRKGGDEKEFLSFLDEYENTREAAGLLDMAELITDHAIISTTSSSLYDVYFNNNVITPSENLNLWGNYFTTIFEFNGIPTSDKSNLGRPYNPRNDSVRINFRYMTYYEGSGAYSYSYHIGWYYEHYWFANFYNARHPINQHSLTEHLIFGIGHELGHALDNEPRKINETTNNFTAALAYFKVVGMPHYEQYQPFEKTLKALSSDYNLDYMAYDDGQIMYTKGDYPNNYDHNYMIWWDLEAVFPGFWARFNNYFRGTIEPGLSDEELYVYYSSLATGVDLSDYYQRWGFYYGKKHAEWSHRFVYSTASERFKTLMAEAEKAGKISKRYDHFWYVDESQYNFMLSQNVAETEKLSAGGRPTITKITNSNGKRKIFIQSEKSQYHLGYEILSKVNEQWKVAGFTYFSTFLDENLYSSNPTYKVVAVNRFFNTSEESEEFSIVSSETSNVCRVEGRYFSSLHDAMENAEDGQTIHLLADCNLQKIYLTKNLTIEVDDSVQNDICIFTNESYIQTDHTFTLKGRANARIIFDGRAVQSANPVIYGTGGEFIAEYVTFRNLKTKFLAGAIYAPGVNVDLSHCIFDSCEDLRAEGAIHALKMVKIYDCTFVNINEVFIYISDIEKLTISQQVNSLLIDFGDFVGSKNITLEGEFSQDIIDKVCIKEGYMLKFNENALTVSNISFILKFYQDGTPFECEVNSFEFEFGTESHEYPLLEHQYVEYIDRSSRAIYKTGDKITLGQDLEFDVKIKTKLNIKIFYNGGEDSIYYAEDEAVYLPVFDRENRMIIAYREGDTTYNAGQSYILNFNGNLTAIYLGQLTYRYIVRDEIYSVGYDTYGQNVELLQLEDTWFQGWKYDSQVVSDSIVLTKDIDLVAMFDEHGVIYQLENCEIRINEVCTYTGGAITPRLTVYFNGVIVPKSCYLITYSNNIDVSTRAIVTINFVEGLSTGSNSAYFTINPKQLSRQDVTVSGLENVVYNGRQTEQSLAFYYQGLQIKTFALKYIGDRVNAGEVQISVEFSGNYTGTIILEYTIDKAERTNFAVLQNGWTYGETSPSPQTHIEEENAKVYYLYSKTKNVEFTSEKPKNAGDYYIKAVIEASQNYKGAEAITQFTIHKADKPNLMPPSEIVVSRQTATLRSVELPQGWTWQNQNQRIDAETIVAYADYFDKDNYEVSRVEVRVTKQPSTESDVSNLLWLIAVVPVVAVIAGWIVSRVVRHKRKWW